MKKNKFLLVVLGILIFLAAANLVMGQEKKEEADDKEDDYTKYDYKFVGESEHWEGEYYLEGEVVWYEDDEYKMQRQYWYEDAGQIRYKGELTELDSLKKIQIEVGSTTSTMTFDEEEGPGREIFTFGNQVDDVIDYPEEPMQVQVTWDGETEVIKLVREDIE
ncbi:hypothetical protein [Ornithinibacillus halophilus]|uniref:Uncharacterized protein n=1 Tax=Ornithinibacillus halophilus TaxID=930117 RepID=A0A1M5NRY0_9BACI|nr:hypothetical protein [Ornithinibacillus halophilus]SHG92364.1 hypothetical protein SAMN05216225_10887 [Ornithinibacillus halophilus]